MTDLGGLEGLLFDKDGTLIDFFATWMPAYCLAADRIAAAAGVPGHADRLLLAGGYDRANDRLAPDSLLAAGTNEELIALWRASLEGRATADLDRIVLETFAEYSEGDITPTADLPALFADLRASGYLLGIATNDDTEAACYAAEHLGLTAMLALVVGADAGHGLRHVDPHEGDQRIGAERAGGAQVARRDRLHHRVQRQHHERHQDVRHRDHRAGHVVDHGDPVIVADHAVPAQPTPDRR